MTRTMKVNLSGREEYELRHPWPEDCFVQGGRSGVVISNKPEGNYRTAYFEAFPDSFIRGEGETLEDAEDACWARYQHFSACRKHVYQPYRPGQADNPKARYSNGAGFCQNCGNFKSNVFTGEQLGQHCTTCGVGTTWGKYGPQARFDPEGFYEIKDPSPEEEKVWYCREHEPFRREIDEHRAERRLELDEAFEELSREDTP